MHKIFKIANPNLLALFMGVADQTIWAVAERPVNLHLAKRLNTAN